MYSRDIATVHLVAPIIRILGYGLNLGLSIYHRKQGVVTSGVIFLFWFLEAIFGVLTFRSVLSTNYVIGPDRLTPFTNYIVQYALVLAMFFLSCWADPKPNYVNLDGK